MCSKSYGKDKLVFNAWNSRSRYSRSRERCSKWKVVVSGVLTRWSFFLKPKTTYAAQIQMDFHKCRWFLNGNREVYLFAQQREVGLMRTQTQHHEIGIQTKKTVAYIRLVVRLTLLVANELHNFVLAFTRNLCETYLLNSKSNIPLGHVSTWCPDKMTRTFCHRGSEDIFMFTKYFSCSCSLIIKLVPGVMQFESKSFSSGKDSPYRIQSFEEYKKENSQQKLPFVEPPFLYFQFLWHV